MEFLSEFVGFVAQCLFWYFIASLVIGFFQRRLEEKEQTFQEQFDKLSKLVHAVNVEQHGEIYYWFDSDTDEFLGQGKDIEEAVEQIKKRYPGHVFLVADKQTNYKLSGPDWKLQPFDIANLKA